MRRAPWLVVGAALALSMLLQLTLFEDAFLFHGDHERDLRYATLWVQRGIWPDSTPSISPTPFELGPLLYMILAPAVAISPDPFWVRVYYQLLATAGGLALFGLLRRHVRWEVAAFTIFGLVASTFWFEMSRQLWHSSLLPLPVAGFLWAAARLAEQTPERPGRDAAIAAGCAAVSLQLHMAAAGIGLVLLGLLALRRRALGVRGVALAVGCGVASLSPLWLTLIQSVRRGALEAMSGGRVGRDWSPAGPGEVLGFVTDNVHTIWGDHGGPWLTWPLMAALLVGAFVVIRRRHRAGLMLLAVVAVGLLVESALLGNQRAHRYMHANMLAIFGLIALGLDAAVDALPRRRVAIAALAVIALGVSVEAVFSEVPHTDERGWLNAREQRAVAEIVATHLHLDEAEMEVRVHGIYFGEPMGMAHMHSLFASGDRKPFSTSAHVMVMPSDLGLTPHGVRDGPVYTVKGGERDIQVYAYEPLLDSSRLQADEGLLRRWRRARAGPRSGGPRLWSLSVPVTRPGIVHLAWSDGRGELDRCPVTVRSAGHDVRLSPLDEAASQYPALRLASVAAEAGTLEVQLGPCHNVVFLDVW